MKHEIGWGEAVQLSSTRWPNGWHEVGQMAAFLNFESPQGSVFAGVIVEKVGEVAHSVLSF